MAAINGDVMPPSEHSAFVKHLLTYPLIQDGVAVFRQNQYGQKSIIIGDSAYKRIAQPVMPYLSRPYQYVSPYVRKADSLGDETLSKVEQRFPIVKEPTQEVIVKAKGFLLLPYNKGMEGKEHVMSLYSAECDRVGGRSLMSYGRALVGTALLLGGETASWVGGFLVSRKEGEKADAANDKANN